MKIMERTLLSLAMICGLGFAAGCGGSDAPTPKDGAAPPVAQSDGHDHPHDDHEHSHDGHGHAPGPHDGTLADWGGGEYHVEFTVDHEKQQATVYVLGDDEKSPKPIPAESIQLSIQDPMMQVTLNAAPQEGDPDGFASRFVGTHESLGVVQEYAGTITGVVDGTPYSGDFEEEPHAAHEH